MWQIHYLRAQELAQDRLHEADQERLACLARSAAAGGPSRLAALRRRGALVATGIARRLDEHVAREQLSMRSPEELPGRSV